VVRFADYNAGKSGGRAQSFSLVKREDGRIVAGGRGRVFLGALEVRGLWIDEAFRGCGLGRALFRAD
jgi:GNAT superfamily N-acetyltransferase